MEDIVEEHLQLLVVVKVSSDDCANRRGSSKASGRDVLSRKSELRRRFVGLCKAAALLSYPEVRVAALQEKPVGTVPVAVDDVCLSVAVKVGQCDSSAMLVLVGHAFTQSHSSFMVYG